MKSKDSNCQPSPAVSVSLGANEVGIILDNMEQLHTAERARAALSILRNIVWQAANDGTMTPDEIYAHIQSVGRDHRCG